MMELTKRRSWSSRSTLFLLLVHLLILFGVFVDAFYVLQHAREIVTHVPPAWQRKSTQQKSYYASHHCECFPTTTALLMVRKQKKKSQRQPANHQKDWQTHFEKTEAYGNANGGVYDLDQMSKSDPELAAWLVDQQKQCHFVLAGQGKKGRITKKRVDAMLRAGMVSEDDEFAADRNGLDNIVIQADDWIAQQAAEERGRIGRMRLKTTVKDNDNAKKKKSKKADNKKLKDLE